MKTTRTEHESAVAAGLVAQARRWAIAGMMALTLLLPRGVHGQATLPAGFSETRIRGISSPTSLCLVPDGRVFVNTQGGSVVVVKNNVLLATPLITLNVSAVEERGLDGIQVDPDFVNNGYLYLYYAVATTPSHNRLSRFTVIGDVANPNTEVVLLEFPALSDSGWHNGGCIQFGPDGKLYVSAGENNIPANAQSMNTTMGKILRLNPDGSIPSDNPFYNITSGNNRAIYALGFRNPYTMAFQPGTGRLFVNDVGSYLWEEINEVVAGGNHGWPTYEGYSTAAGFRSPIYTYPHPTIYPTSSAITGGTFYNPPVANFPPQYVGKYFFADGFQQFIKVLDPATRTVTPFATFPYSIYSDPIDTRAVTALYPTTGSNGFLYYLGRSPISAQYSSLNIIRYVGGSAPIIGAHPASQIASVGGSAVFDVGANGNAPLSFQWARMNLGAGSFTAIPGATTSRLILNSLGAVDNGAQFRCTITNLVGSATSTAATLTVSAGGPPTPVITQPADGAFYRAGDTLAFEGYSTDPQDGTLPPANLSWKVNFHHLEHFHPVFPDTAGISNGSVYISPIIETSPVVWFRISLTATDSSGLSTTVFRDILPVKSTNTLATDPPGLQVFFDGHPAPTPTNWIGVVGVTRTLGAPDQYFNGNLYTFDSWSDAGAVSHDIATPEVATTYTARFRVVPPVDNAQMTSETVPAQMTAGVNYSVSVRMQNTGNTIWPANSAYVLAAQNPANNTTWRATPVNLTSPVNPGESFTFTFTVTAPPAAGPYNLQWQMQKAGAFFGTPSDNAVVNVSLPAGPGANGATFVSQSVPLIMAPGGTYNVLVTMQNTGTGTWSADTKHRLGSANLQDNTRWGFTRVSLTNDNANSVPPGGFQTFNFRVKAPVTPGQYNFQWRMVQELVGWFGQVSANQIITVTATGVTPVTIAQPPTSLTVNAGQPAGFFAGAIGSSPITFQWQRKSAGAAGFTSIPGATAAAFRLDASSGADDAAQFRCVATNPAGSVTSPAATLTVNGGGGAVPPNITLPPAAQNVTTGQAANFSVTATGTAPLFYQWARKNPADPGFLPIPGANAQNYNIPATVLGDSGALFQCVVTNSAGTATSANALLTVSPPVGTPPSIIVPPASQSIAVGAAANFSLTVSGSAPFTYQWQRKNPADAGFSPIALAVNPTYQIPAVGAGENGAQFRCVVSNLVGSATSDPATLTVTGIGGGIAPTIVSFTPASGIRQVPIGASVQVVFSKDMDPATINANTLTLIRKSTTVALPATITYNPANRTVTLTPTSPLKPDWSYNVTVVGGAAGVKDLGGLALASTATWNFYTTDTLGPRISGIAVTALTANSATVVWDSNENADTQIFYGLTSAYGQASPLVGALVLHHSVTLNSLTRGTTYNYQIRSRDGFGNLTATPNATFTTAP